MIRSKGGGSVVDSLFIVASSACLFCDWSLLLSDLSSFEIISLRKRELLALLCFLAVVWLSVLCASSMWCCGLVCGL